MARNLKNNRKPKEVVPEEQLMKEVQSISMTDAEIAQKYHLDEHSWEGTVAIWKIRKEMGIK